MQEDDQDLRDEHNKEMSGYNDWRSDNITDLKAEFLTQYSVQDLIHHFYWEEETIEDFFEGEEVELEEYIALAYEGYCEVKDEH